MKSDLRELTTQKNLSAVSPLPLISSLYLWHYLHWLFILTIHGSEAQALVEIQQVITDQDQKGIDIIVFNLMEMYGYFS